MVESRFWLGLGLGLGLHSAHHATHTAGIVILKKKKKKKRKKKLSGYSFVVENLKVKVKVEGSMVDGLTMNE